MAHIRYGCLNPNARTVEYPVAASQYFRHDGPNFVYLDGSGHVTLAIASTATLFGYAIVPTGGGAGTSPNDYWLSSATAAADRIPVIHIDEDEDFICLADDLATASQAGNACDLDAVNDGTAYYVNIGTSSTDVLIIQGLASADPYKVAGAATNDVIVKMNPAKRQTDT
jgi:hypothetical protein